MKKNIRRKMLMYVTLFSVGVSNVAMFPVGLKASEVKGVSDEAIEEHIESLGNEVTMEVKKDELLSDSGNMSIDEVELINSVPEEAVIINTSVDDEKFEEVTESSDAAVVIKEYGDYFNSIINNEDGKYTLEDEFVGETTNGVEFTLKQVGSSVVIEIAGQQYAYAESIYVDYVDPSAMKQARASGYTYLYTSNITNKDWHKVLEASSVGVATGILFFFPALAKQVNIGRVAVVQGIIKYGNMIQVKLYAPMKVYRSNVCPYKGKKVTQWYQKRTETNGGNYTYSYPTGSSKTTYYDNTTSYQKC